MAHNNKGEKSENKKENREKRKKAGSTLKDVS
jgi:hypothetical protein